MFTGVLLISNSAGKRRHDTSRRVTLLTRSRYDHLSLVASLSSDPAFHWCLAPGCNSGQLHATDNPILACGACSYRQCVRHKTAWHEGETCEEYDDRVSGRRAAAEEEASNAKITETTKACPNCNTRIEKNQGCDHMTCKICKYQFCWACRCDWVKAASDAKYHESFCKYYRPYGD